MRNTRYSRAFQLPHEPNMQITHAPAMLHKFEYHFFKYFIKIMQHGERRFIPFSVLFIRFEFIILSHSNRYFPIIPIISQPNKSTYTATVILHCTTTKRQSYPLRGVKGKFAASSTPFSAKQKSSDRRSARARKVPRYPEWYVHTRARARGGRRLNA